jgi:hypothetical protein
MPNSQITASPSSAHVLACSGGEEGINSERRSAARGSQARSLPLGFAMQRGAQRAINSLASCFDSSSSNSRSSIGDTRAKGFEIMNAHTRSRVDQVAFN